MSGSRHAFAGESAEHRAAVEALFARCSGRGDNARVIDTLDAAMGAIWRRAERTMGAVTLTAIMSRVLHEASQTYPFLADVEQTEHGTGLVDLRSRAEALPRADLEAAAKLLLVRFLSVLGNLTADVLTAALHAELETLNEGKQS